jgi:hypothetical protein
MAVKCIVHLNTLQFPSRCPVRQPPELFVSSKSSALFAPLCLLKCQVHCTGAGALRSDRMSFEPNCFAFRSWPAACWTEWCAT